MARKARSPKARAGPSKPFGFVLVLRALARAAIMLKERPAALRVLCCMCDYMNADGLCRVGQGTIAARLTMTRQAVGQHIRALRELDILSDVSATQFTEKGLAGRTHEYWIVQPDDLADERAGQEGIDEYRKSRRAQRAIAKAKAEGDELVTFANRIGFPAYKQLMAPSYYLDEGQRPDAIRAMEAMERAAGVRYVFVVSDEDGLQYYRQVQA